MTKLEIIRQACIKANPKIMELKFGCKLNFFNNESLTDGIVCEIYKSGYIGIITKNGYFETEKAYIYTILGREIKLADVLLALDKISTDKYHNYYLVLTDGEFIKIIEGEKEFTGIFWDLKNDNLELQSEETLQFISDLLKENNGKQ